MKNNFASKLLQALVQRRTRSGFWVYPLWFLANLPFMLFFADFVFVNLRPFQWLPLLVPLAVVTVQIIYPTLLGWAVIMIPSVFFAVEGVVAVILTASGRVQEGNVAALFVSSAVVVIYALICVALWFARPKQPEAAAVLPKPDFYEKE